MSLIKILLVISIFTISSCFNDKNSDKESNIYQKLQGSWYGFEKSDSSYYEYHFSLKDTTIHIIADDFARIPPKKFTVKKGNILKSNLKKSKILKINEDLLKLKNLENSKIYKFHKIPYKINLFNKNVKLDKIEENFYERRKKYTN